MIENKIIDARTEKNIITGMIISDEFLSGIQQIFQPLQIPFAHEVAGWCLDYFKQYEKAPNEHIQDLFFANKNRMSEEQVELTEDFLLHISNENEEKCFNVKYILDCAEKYFRLLAVQKISNELCVNLTKNNVDKAENTIKTFERCVRSQTKGINPFDTDTIKTAFDTNSGNTLFKFPGVLGETVGYFEREHLVSFVGASKIGKSWWLMWIAMLALFEGYKVIYVSLEMSEKQMVKRIHQYINACPTKQYNDLLIPVLDCARNQNDSCVREERSCSVGVCDGDEELDYYVADKKGYKVCTNCTEDIMPEIWHKTTNREPLNEIMVLEKNKALYGNLIKKDRFKLIKYPSKGATMEDLKTQLQNMENYENFIPDVIVTDMADKFSVDNNRQDFRHQISEIWESHKRIAQEKKCLVVTASQANTMRTQKDVGQGDWAENIKKIQESDISFALNQKPEEKKKGLMRVTVLAQRDDDFDLSSHVNVLMSYIIGRPYLNSYKSKE
ncbi:MAG: hypothetical protein GY821_12880 [Gammaproteobacteria bacterium]|nr:hypothetical protein [Gammaproteobacteria bacterium]